MTNLLEQKLQTLYNENKPDPVFAEQLEQQLRTRYSQPNSLPSPVPRYINRVTRRIATIAASLVIMVVLFATVVPLRSFAQSIIDFFIPGDGYFAPDTEETYDDVITVETIVEAEAIAGIEALEWVEGGFNILHIGAAEGFISIAYERENDRGVLMHISKWHTGIRREQLPISPATEIVNTTVGGEVAQFASGY